MYDSSNRQFVSALGPLRSVLSHITLSRLVHGDQGHSKVRHARVLSCQRQRHPGIG